MAGYFTDDGTWVMDSPETATALKGPKISSAEQSNIDRNIAEGMSAEQATNLELSGFGGSAYTDKALGYFSGGGDPTGLGYANILRGIPAIPEYSSAESSSYEAMLERMKRDDDYSKRIISDKRRRDELMRYLIGKDQKEQSQRGLRIPESRDNTPQTTAQRFKDLILPENIPGATPGMPSPDPQLSQKAEAMGILEEMGRAGGPGAGTAIATPDLDQIVNRPMPSGGTVSGSASFIDPILESMNARIAGRPETSGVPASARPAASSEPALPSSMPSLTDGLSNQDRDIIANLGGTPEAEKLVRQARQDFNIKEAASLNSGKELRKSLVEQGVPEEDIKDALKGARTAQEGINILSKMQRDIQKSKFSTNEQRRDSRMDKRANTNKTAAFAVDVRDRMQEQGPDPEGGKMIDYATEAQKKSLDRMYDKSSMRKLSTSDIKNAERIMKKVTRQAEEAKVKSAFERETEKFNAEMDYREEQITDKQERRQMAKDKKEADLALKTWQSLAKDEWAQDTKKTINGKKETDEEKNTRVAKYKQKVADAEAEFRRTYSAIGAGAGGVVTPGTVLDEVSARSFLEQAGGDKEAARRMAIEAGYTL